MMTSKGEGVIQMSAILHKAYVVNLSKKNGGENSQNPVNGVYGWPLSQGSEIFAMMCCCGMSPIPYTFFTCVSSYADFW